MPWPRNLLSDSKSLRLSCQGAIRAGVSTYGWRLCRKFRTIRGEPSLTWSSLNLNLVGVIYLLFLCKTVLGLDSVDSAIFWYHSLFERNTFSSNWCASGPQTDKVRDSFRVILQMALILTFGGSVPVIKVNSIGYFLLHSLLKFTVDLIRRYGISFDVKILCNALH